jgi:hypothetical protein
MRDMTKNHMNLENSLDRQQGSAMTEFAVLCLVMVPMFSIMPILGKVSDVNQTTIQASRYAAWERTIHDEGEKNDDRLSVEVSNLFYSDPDELVRTNEGLLSGDDHVNQFWTGYGVVDGEQSRLVGDSSNKLKSFVATSNEGLPGSVSGILSGGVSSILSAMSDFSGNGSWDVEENGLYVARVGANIKSNSFLDGDKDCEDQENDEVFSCLRRHNAILVDSWAASGSDQVEQRVKSMVPTGALEPVANLTKVMSIVPFMKEFGKLDEDAFGYVAPDVLPPDRYGNE